MLVQQQIIPGLDYKYLANLIISRNLRPEHFYSSDFIKEYSRIIATTFSVVDLISPISSIIVGRSYDIKRVIDFDIEPEFSDIRDEILSLINSQEWDDSWRDIIRNAVIFGEGYARVAISDTGPVIIPLPWDTYAVINPITHEIIGVRAFWDGNVYGEYSFEADAENIVETAGGVKRKTVNTLGFVPVVCLKSPDIDVKSGRGQSLVYPAIDGSRSATQILNDIIVLCHSQGFAILTVKGTNIGGGGKDSPPVISPGTILELPDKDADAQWISPQSKLADLISALNQIIMNTVMSCGIPPMLFNPTGGTSNASAGAISPRMETLYNTCSRIQKKITAAQKRAVCQIISMITNYPIDVVTKAVKYNVRYEYDIPFVPSVQEVTAIRQLLDYKLLKFVDAYRIINPGATMQEAEEAEQAFNNGSPNMEKLLNNLG